MSTVRHKPIGVFDSGYGGLTILTELKKALPNYDFIYLGDNARAPYGTRSFDVVYEFTLQAVDYLFAQGCDLVILACNTASAKALRTIQQHVLPQKYPGKKVLGVIRPTTEIIGQFTKSKHIGVVATQGTINSMSYVIEINKFFPELVVNQWACPIWVSLIESNLHNTVGGRLLIQQDVIHLLEQDEAIDTILLACTHFPIVSGIIEEVLPESVQLVSQGEIVADSLVSYLKRHPELDHSISKTKHLRYLTTENEEVFAAMATRFIDLQGEVNHVRIEI